MAILRIPGDTEKVRAFIRFYGLPGRNAAVGISSEGTVTADAWVGFTYKAKG